MNDYIIKSANLLIEQCKTRDPYRIAEMLGIYLNYDYLGKLKGYYYVLLKERHIVVNNILQDNEKLVVIAHELAHDRLHREFATTAPIRDFVLYDMVNKIEYQANMFAAELLIDDNNVQTLVNECGYDFFQTCNVLHIKPEFFAFKLFAMARKGHLVNLPICLNSTFLKD